MIDAVQFHSSHSGHFLERYAQSAAFRERYEIWSALIDRHTPEGGTVLDVGCGPGLFSVRAARRAAQVTGIDGSREMLVLAEAVSGKEGLSNVDFQQLWVADIPNCVVKKFDLVLCSSVLEYLPDLAEGIRILCDRVSPGGALILSLPNAWSPYRAVESIVFALTGKPDYRGHVKHVVKPGIVAKHLTANGMTVEHLNYYGSPFRLDRARNWLYPKAIFNNIFVMVSRKAPV